MPATETMSSAAGATVPDGLALHAEDPVLRLVARTPAYVHLDTTVRAIAEMMAEESIGVSLVHGPQGPAGIVSERDVAMAVAQGLDPDRERARDIMTPDLATVDVRESVLRAAERMLANEIRHLVVLSGATAVGVISVRDVLGVLADQIAEP